MSAPPRQSKKQQKPPTLTDRFNKFARHVSEVAGTAWTSLAAILIIVIWAVTGPLFGFSDTWQLVINTGTTIITFIMVFIIQNTQNRDAKAMHLKVDELIRAMHGARNSLVDLEDMADDELNALAEEFAALHERERDAFEERGHSLLPDECEKPEKKRHAK